MHTLATNGRRRGSNTYLARYGYGRISAEGGRFVIDDDNKGLLTLWHYVLGALSVWRRVKTSAHSCQCHLQPPHEMSQLTRAGLGIFSPWAHVDDGASILVETCKDAVPPINSVRANMNQNGAHIFPVSLSILTWNRHVCVR